MEAPPCVPQPTYLRLNQLRRLFKSSLLLLLRLTSGTPTALKDLRQALDAHPEIWRQVGDLAAHVEQTWLRLAAEGNALAEESIRREADRIRTELLGTSPTVIEKLLVDQIIACWLQLKHAEIIAGSGAKKVSCKRRFFDQRLGRAQSRYFAAMKMLSAVLDNSACAKPASEGRVKTGH